MNHRLTETELVRFVEDGYVLRRDVFDRDELDAITSACEALVRRVVANREENRRSFGSYVFDRDDELDVTIKWEGDTDVVHGLEPFAHLSPELERWALDARFVDPMVDMVGDDHPMLFTEKLNLKRPRHGGINPFHQDFPYWDGLADDATRVATAMLFLDDATLGNGTLQVVPGSHRDGMWPTRRDGDPFGNLEIDPSVTEGRPTVPIEVDAGAIVFFGPFLVHTSAPNRSDDERRSLLYSYQPAGLTHGRECIRRGREARETAAT
jgi:phytanoyl-CoA hydroxylase